MTYFLLEVLKLSVIVACKKLPVSPKTFFIFAETIKLLIVGLVMLGIHLSGNLSDPTKPINTNGGTNESIQRGLYQGVSELRISNGSSNTGTNR